MLGAAVLLVSVAIQLAGCNGDDVAPPLTDKEASQPFAFGQSAPPGTLTPSTAPSRPPPKWRRESRRQPSCGRRFITQIRPPQPTHDICRRGGNIRTGYTIVHARFNRANQSDWLHRDIRTEPAGQSVQADTLHTVLFAMRFLLRPCHSSLAVRLTTIVNGITPGSRQPHRKGFHTTTDGFPSLRHRSFSSWCLSFVIFQPSGP
ncbi:hypothetical protein OKW33_006640 [Paraburkholderia atlantica]|uniref:Uncharacterized protein n=1 Tax=Paraburkholderia atlantica TaxID=2654982 RepID=A0A7W8QEM6_PARAM|nr:hypothetical protein [Paraburkholderia atlantica]